MTDMTMAGGTLETAIIEQPAVIEGAPAFAWGPVIAGALVASAVSFILLALGAGIGFVSASPYWGPSAATLTAAAAIWIVLAQTWGYACGGYVAGRMRTRAGGYNNDETNFRDGVHGFVAWALGVVLTTTMIALGAAFAGGATATLGAGAASGAGSAMANRGGGNAGSGPAAYFADALLRPDANRPQSASTVNPGTETVGGGAQAARSNNNAQASAEATRIFGVSVIQGRLSDEDRSYLATLVSERTGMSQAEAQQRVATTENQLRQNVKDAADKAAKAASMLSFWTFMALLMGAVAATVGGIFGGSQRDEAMMLTPR